jgi:hypothetical protein
LEPKPGERGGHLHPNKFWWWGGGKVEKREREKERQASPLTLFLFAPSNQIPSELGLEGAKRKRGNFLWFPKVLWAGIWEKGRGQRFCKEFKFNFLRLPLSLQLCWNSLLLTGIWSQMKFASPTLFLPFSLSLLLFSLFSIIEDYGEEREKGRIEDYGEERHPQIPSEFGWWRLSLFLWKRERGICFVLCSSPISQHASSPPLPIPLQLSLRERSGRDDA